MASNNNDDIFDKIPPKPPVPPKPVKNEPTEEEKKKIKGSVDTNGNVIKPPPPPLRPSVSTTQTQPIQRTMSAPKGMFDKPLTSAPTTTGGPRAPGARPMAVSQNASRPAVPSGAARIRSAPNVRINNIPTGTQPNRRPGVNQVTTRQTTAPQGAPRVAQSGTGIKGPSQVGQRLPAGTQTSGQPHLAGRPEQANNINNQKPVSSGARPNSVQTGFETQKQTSTASYFDQEAFNKVGRAEKPDVKQPIFEDRAKQNAPRQEVNTTSETKPSPEIMATPEVKATTEVKSKNEVKTTSEIKAEPVVKETYESSAPVKNEAASSSDNWAQTHDVQYRPSESEQSASSSAPYSSASTESASSSNAPTIDIDISSQNENEQSSNEEYYDQSYDNYEQPSGNEQYVEGTEQQYNENAEQQYDESNYERQPEEVYEPQQEGVENAQQNEVQNEQSYEQSEQSEQQYSEQEKVPEQPLNENAQTEQESVEESASEENVETTPARPAPPPRPPEIKEEEESTESQQENIEEEVPEAPPARPVPPPKPPTIEVEEEEDVIEESEEQPENPPERPVPPPKPPVITKEPEAEEPEEEQPQEEEITEEQLEKEKQDDDDKATVGKKAKKEKVKKTKTKKLKNIDNPDETDSLGNNMDFDGGENEGKIKNKEEKNHKRKLLLILFLLLFVIIFTLFFLFFGEQIFTPPTIYYINPTTDQETFIIAKDLQGEKFMPGSVIMFEEVLKIKNEAINAEGTKNNMFVFSVNAYIEYNGVKQPENIIDHLIFSSDTAYRRYRDNRCLYFYRDIVTTREEVDVVKGIQLSGVNLTNSEIAGKEVRLVFEVTAQYPEEELLFDFVLYDAKMFDWVYTILSVADTLKQQGYQ